MLKTELDWNSLLNNIAKHAQSEKAKEAVFKIKPFSTVENANLSAENILFAQRAAVEEALPDLAILDSLTGIFERLRIQSTLEIREFVILRKFLQASLQLKNILRLDKNSWCEAQVLKLTDFKNQVATINKAISLDGEINEDATPTLKSLYDEKKKLTRDVAQILDRVIAKRNVENLLQDRYVTTRDGRLVLPIKSGSQHDFKGLIHDRSFTKQTVFMEPEEALPLNNRLRDLHLLILEEIEKILRTMSHYFSRQLTELSNAEATLLECDITFAKAHMNSKIKGTKVIFNNFKKIFLKAIKHPLFLLEGIDVVPNTVQLDSQNRVLLLSGPNAGGKTVLLKSLGLCCQMARCGLPIPAEEGSSVPFFTQIDPIVGDLQSVENHLSSFSSHIQRLNETLNHKGSETLVLVDEICGATDPEEGSALARSFIDEYLENEIFAVVTSHLSPLKENWPKNSGLLHGSLEFDRKINKPTYQLLTGIPGQSLAINVASRLGVPQKIIQRAENYLSPTSKHKTQNLKEIEDLREQILEIKQEVEKEKKEAHSLKEQYVLLVNRFREQRDRWLEKALVKAEKKIEQVIEDARQDRLRNKTIQDIKSDLPEIIKAPSTPNRPQTQEEFKKIFLPGTPAFCSRLGREVIIQSAPDEKGQVSVLADVMRVVVPWHTLSNKKEIDPRGQIKLDAHRIHEKHSPGSQSFGVATARASKRDEDSAPTLDLRGKRVDDAMILVEKWLDQKMGDGVEQVKIVHGFGTEQLKKALRQYLSKSHYVSKWTAGESSSGGDGITWVTLSD